MFATILAGVAGGAPEPMARRMAGGTMSAAIPDGFRPANSGGPFGKEVGPFYLREGESEFRIGLRIVERHINPNGVVHGGVYMTLADHVGSTAIFRSLSEKVPFATISLNCDFLAPAKAGDWIEGWGEVVRRTRTLAFANATIELEGQPIVRASGIWKLSVNADRR